MEENTKLKEKLEVLKTSVFELKNYLENDIYVKLELKAKLLKEALDVNDQLEKRIEALVDGERFNRSLEDQMHMYRDKYNEGLKEKIDLQKLTNRQEATIKSLELELSLLQESILLKDNRYRELHQAINSINKAASERNRLMLNLQDRHNKKTNEEKGHKLLLYQKEQEILLLRNQIKSNKSLSKSNSRSLIDLSFSRKKNKGVFYNEKKSNTLAFNRYSSVKNDISYEHEALNRNDEDEWKLKEIRDMVDELLKA